MHAYGASIRSAVLFLATLLALLLIGLPTAAADERYSGSHHGRSHA